MPNREELLQEIFEQDDIQMLYSNVDEFISNYEGVLEELEGYIEEISEDIFAEYTIEEFRRIALRLYDMLNILGITQDQSKVEIIERAMSEEIRDIIIEDLVNLFSKIMIDTNIVKSSSFDEDSIVFGYENVFKQRVEVRTSGNIFAERGSSNDINIYLIIDEEQVQGIITKQYGNYEINDEQGYAMPIVSDDLDINIKCVLDNLYNHFEETLSEIERFNEYLSSLIFKD